jgi:hypothetical protein
MLLLSPILLPYILLEWLLFSGGHYAVSLVSMHIEFLRLSSLYSTVNAKQAGEKGGGVEGGGVGGLLAVWLKNTNKECLEMYRQVFFKSFNWKMEQTLLKM